MLRSAAILLALQFVSCLPQAEAPPLIDQVKREFVVHSSTDMESYEVCEVVDEKDDKKRFLERSLKGKYKPGSEAVLSKEIFVRETNAKGHLHLGIVVLTYPGETSAIRILEKVKPGGAAKYFGNTKILTRYDVLRRGKTVVFVYSETFNHGKLKQFFDRIGPRVNQ